MRFEKEFKVFKEIKQITLGVTEYVLDTPFFYGAKKYYSFTTCGVLPRVVLNLISGCSVDSPGNVMVNYTSSDGHKGYDLMRTDEALDFLGLGKIDRKIFQSLMKGYIRKSKLEYFLDANRLEFEYHPSKDVIQVHASYAVEFSSKVYKHSSGIVFFSRLPEYVKLALIRKGAGKHVYQ